jgi:hypothetical protein
MITDIPVLIKLTQLTRLSIIDYKQSYYNNEMIREISRLKNLVDFSAIPSHIGNNRWFDV